MNARDKMHQRNALMAVDGPILDLLKQTPLTEYDVGKIFYVGPTQTAGMLISYETFKTMDVSKVDNWLRIRASDIAPR